MTLGHLIDTARLDVVTRSLTAQPTQPPRVADGSGCSPIAGSIAKCEPHSDQLIVSIEADSRQGVGTTTVFFLRAFLRSGHGGSAGRRPGPHRRIPATGLMSTARGMRARLVAVAAATLTGLCAGILAAQPVGAASFAPISGAGSTWSANAINAWRANVAQYGMVVNYAGVGSTIGRNEFKQGTVAWAGSDIPYGVRDGNNFDPPPTTRGFAYMPDTAGGTVLMYNLKIGIRRVTNLRLSGDTIAKIFTGVIQTWNDPAIAADNPGLTLPALPVVPVYRSDGSGSTAQFTHWMVARESSYWNAYCAKVG